MYAEFFGLSELPFNNTPDPRFFFPTPDHEEALASMIYAISESKGFMLLTGEVGAGKTLLTKMVLHHFGNRICAATVNHALRSVGDLLASVCYEFGIPVPSDASTAHCTRALQDFLIAHYSHNTPVVLLIDEAQALPPEGFEQLRMLGNLEDDNAKLLQTLIVGQPELRRIFQARDMRQLRQRLFRTFHLPALDLQQCQGYVRHRLGVAGAGEADIFDDSAMEVIHRHAQGLPRLINTICDNAMLSAYSADSRVIDGGFVEAVITQMLTLDQRYEARMPTYETHGPSSVGHYHAANERFTQMESLYAALATRLGGLEERCQEIVTAVSAVAGLPAAVSSAAPPAGASGSVASSPDAAAESAPAPAPVARAEDTTAPFVEAVDKLRRSIRRTEKKLIIAGRHTDQQLVRLASKTDQVARRIPELAAT
jgi:general secretion pathway protein A